MEGRLMKTNWLIVTASAAGLIVAATAAAALGGAHFTASGPTSLASAQIQTLDVTSGSIVLQLTDVGTTFNAAGPAFLYSGDLVVAKPNPLLGAVGVGPQKIFIEADTFSGTLSATLTVHRVP